MRNHLVKNIILFCVMLVSLQATAQPAVPKLTGYVTDLTGTLSSEDIRGLNTALKIFDDSASTQIAVLMIGSLEGSDIDSYSHDVATANAIGQKGENNGVLVVIAKDDRKLRIEVGYGLEGVLTDALTSQIRQNFMNPRFRENDYAGGIRDGVTAIMQVVRGEFTSEKKVGAKKNRFPIIPILFVVFFLFALFGRRGRTSVVGGSGVGTGLLTGIFLSSLLGGGRHSGGHGGGGGGFGGFGGGSFGGGGSSGSW